MLTLKEVPFGFASSSAPAADAFAPPASAYDALVSPETASFSFSTSESRVLAPLFSAKPIQFLLCPETPL